MPKTKAVKYLGMFLSLAVFLVLPLYSIVRVFAAGESIYFAPSSKRAEANSTFSVDVRINPNGTPINTISTTLTFDSSKLTLLSKSVAGAPLQPLAESMFTSTAGSVSLDAAKLGGQITADSLAMTLTFKALAGSGTTSLGFSKSEAYRADNNNLINLSRGNASIAFTTTAAPPPGGSSTVPTGTSSATPAPGSSSAADPTTSGESKTSSVQEQTPGAPRIVESRSFIQYSKASFVVKTDVPTTAYIKFGTDGNLNQRSAELPMAKDHKIVLDPDLLLPGVTYAYSVVLTGEGGLVTTTKDLTMTTKGIPLKIRVLGQDGKPLKYIPVTLRSSPRTAKTDKDGNVSFEAAVGAHTLEYLKGSSKYSQSIKVANNIRDEGDKQTAEVQAFTVKFGTVQQSSQPWLIYTSGGILLALAAIFLIFRRRQWNFVSSHSVEKPLAGSITGGSNTTKSPSSDSPLSQLSYPANIKPGVIIQAGSARANTTPEENQPPVSRNSATAAQLSPDQDKISGMDKAAGDKSEAGSGYQPQDEPKKPGEDGEVRPL